MAVNPDQTLIDALIAEPSPLLVGHVTPDADCLASMFALAYGLSESTGTTVLSALPDGSLSQRLDFFIDLVNPAIASDEQCQSAERLIACDTAKFSRINLPSGQRQELPPERVAINIDHHASNEMFAQLNWVDDHSSSTSELVYRIFKFTGWHMPPAIASLLYAGIHSDTVGFSLNTTAASTLSAAAELISWGADIALIGEKLCRSQTESEFKLRRIIYANTQISSTGRIAFSSASHDEISRAGCSASDIDDQVEIPRSLAGTEIALLFTEGVPGKIRINLRGTSNILDLAKLIGGGGHRAAAGAIMSGTIEDAIAHLVPLAEQYLDGSVPTSS